MFLKFEDSKWQPAPSGIPFASNTSINIEDIPAPPPVDARMAGLECKNGTFTLKYFERQREDDRMPYEVPVFYQWRYTQWKRLN